MNTTRSCVDTVSTFKVQVDQKRQDRNKSALTNDSGALNLLIEHINLGSVENQKSESSEKDIAGETKARFERTQNREKLI